MRLRAMGLGAFHVDANFLHPSSWHRVVSQCPAPPEIKQMLLVDGTIDGLKQPGFTSGARLIGAIIASNKRSFSAVPSNNSPRTS